MSFTPRVPIGRPRVIDGTVVLAGAAGILGTAFTPLLPADRLVSLGRTELEPADPDAVVRRIVQLAPRLLINCAADTDVEGAEAAPERAFAVNATLAGALARGAAETGATMLHMSSTGCYGDWKDTPYQECDPLRPTTAHHRSKAAGEEAVLRACQDALILRLGWLFGGHPGQRKNFVWARLAEARGATEIGSNPNQTGNPTAASDVAALALELAQAGVTGVANCVGGGAPASRLAYVTAILAAGGLSTLVKPITFARRAPVSPNEAATNTRLHSLGCAMPDWSVSLGMFVRFLTADATPG